ncbi:MAG: RND transporter [Sphingobium sp.]|nr:MAG: RND transporter [Sphingobium sp.]
MARGDGALRLIAACVATALLGACSMAPAYHPPETAAPVAFKEVPPGWMNATPMDMAARGQWWTMFGDPVLDDLEARAERASPSLAAALARYDQARASAQAAGADLYPQIGVSGSVSRERVSANRPLSLGSAAEYDNYRAGGAASYELDLWGRIRNRVKAGKAEADASEADLGGARLSLQALVADAYFRLRGLDAEAGLLRQTVEAFGRAYDLTATRHEGGIASGMDVNRAHTVLADARAQISAIAADRAATEHEIATLLGEVASSFAIAPTTAAMTPPAPAGETPSELLQRRPDIAAAERRMFAANARIGVARAAFFPTIGLGASGGFQTTHGDLLTQPNHFWALGPLSAALAIFDGGRRSAAVKMSRAQYDEAAADYRDTVLTAFRQVEDALADNRYLAAQAIDQQEAADAADRTSDLALTRYRDGASDYLEVVTAQTAALSAQRSVIALQTQRMRASIALVRAMGGGYERPDGRRDAVPAGQP